MKVSTYIYQYKRTPFTPLNHELSHFHPSKILQLLLKGLKRDHKLSLSQITDFTLVNAMNAGFGQYLNHRIAADCALKNVNKNTHLKQGAIGALQAMYLDYNSENKGLKLMYAFENLSSVPDYSQNPNRAQLSTAQVKFNKVVLNGLTREFGYIDRIKNTIWDEFNTCAKSEKIKKDAIDKYAFNSRFKFRTASLKGWHQSEIEGLSLKDKNKKKLDVKIDGLSVFLPNQQDYKDAPLHFKKNKFISKANCTVPADGAVAILYSNELLSKQKPVAEIFGCHESYAHAGNYIENGVNCITEICKKYKIQLSDLDFVECHEDSPVTIIALAKKLKLDLKKFNILGGGLSTGDAVSASGARLISSACSLLTNSKLKLGLINITSPFGVAVSLLIRKV